MERKSDSPVKIYLVTVYGLQRGSIFLVSARTAKEAVDILWREEMEYVNKFYKEKGYDLVLKKGIHAVSLERLRKEQGRVIEVY